VTFDLHVAVVLDPFLLTLLHRCIAPVGIGSSGAEGLAAVHLTSSLDNSMSIAPMPVPDPSVKPVPKGCFHLIPFGAQTCTDAWASVLSTTIGCTDGAMSVYPVLQVLHSFRPICCDDLLDPLNIFLSGFSLYFGTSTIDWTYHLDGGLDVASQQWIERFDSYSWDLKILQV
jgi:hypothetical protein